MGYDAMANDTSVPAIAREVGKKKRANRSAKLKQCKLDARREQWLSQVKNNGNKNISAATSPTSPPQGIPKGRSAVRDQQHRAAVAAALERDGPGLHDGSDVESPNSGGNASRKGCPSNNNTSSSGSSIGSCSRSVSDAEEEDDTGEDKGIAGGLDDWEAVADALSVSPDNDKGNGTKPSALPSHIAVQSETMPTRPREPTKPEPDRIVPRAWRLDDAFRPQSLPILSRQRSFSLKLEQHCNSHLHDHRGILSPPPSSCPICYEDLDLTDSSFLPCLCGFRLCLFCHKRILEADGRCPGCRKQYAALEGDQEIGNSVGVPPIFPNRLSRSCSMSSRS